MIPPDIRAEVTRRLRDAEEEHDVRVLLAVESGSRAWGFASPDSDYDARFIYAHRPDWYLSIGLEDQRDVIGYPIVDDIDLNGWDVRKALRLFWKSNPAFVEWIQSPIVYVDRGPFASQARMILSVVYSCERGAQHYRSWARTAFRRHLTGDLVSLKRYFYVLRALLALRWLARHGSAAPIEFHRLFHLIEDDAALIAEIEELLARKRAAPDLALSPPIPVIDAFIQGELARTDAFSSSPLDRASVRAALDAILRESVREAWA